jgi:hypothetical protein
LKSSSLLRSRRVPLLQIQHKSDERESLNAKVIMSTRTILSVNAKVVLSACGTYALSRNINLAVAKYLVIIRLVSV